MDDFDSILLVSFGGPEGPDDVMPFLDNVLRGKNVPDARKREVAENYRIFGGKSPINPFMRRLRADLAAAGAPLPIYWGNRNWAPYLKDELARMRAAGHRRPIVFVTSAFSSYSGCRQYREDIEAARAALGWQDFSYAKVRAFFNHPSFIAANADEVRAARAASGSTDARLIFTAHSLPSSMAAGCAYEAQLREAARLVAADAGARDWELAYQSRSGPPTQPWLEPSVLDAIHKAKAEGRSGVVVAPIGFVTDHMEVMFDLDVQAKELAASLGLGFARARTAGHHAAFVPMVLDLVDEVRAGRAPKLRGDVAADPAACAPGCCPAGHARPSSAAPRPSPELERARSIGLVLWFPPLLLAAAVALGVWMVL